MDPSRRTALRVVLVAAALLVGCGGGEGAQEREAAESGPDGANPGRERPEPIRVTTARCPADVAGCRSASGRIVYVERVDPDGDGDAHFVIADPQGITLRGLTVIDVRRELRPRQLPGPGDLISAAGPVQTGSYGQSQIHAMVLHVARR